MSAWVDELKLGDLILTRRGLAPAGRSRPLPALWAVVRLRDAAAGGGAGAILELAEGLGAPAQRPRNTLEHEASLRLALERLERALESGALTAFEREPEPLQVRATAPPEPPPPPAPARAERSVVVVQVLDQAGKPVPQADVALNSATVGASQADGAHVQGSVDPGSYRVAAVREGYRAAETTVEVGPDQTVQARIQLQRIVARLVWPANGAAHKQYVNLDADPAEPAHGQRIAVRVGIVDGRAGDRLYLKLDWDDAKVSKRNDPPRQVVRGMSAPWCPKGGAVVTLRADGEEPLVELDLGLAGGDELTVAVGGTTECADARCTITTWRKLWYEVMAPDFMGVGDDVGAGHRTRIDELLLPCFVEYRVWKAHTFLEADAPAGTVYEGAYFAAARTQFVLTDHTFKLYPSREGAWDGGKRPRSIGLRLCDRNYFNEAGATVQLETLTARTGTFDVRGAKQRWVLPTSAADGRPAVKRIRWKAHFERPLPRAHPGLVRGAPRTGELPLDAVRFVSIEEFEVTLPDGTAAAPGPGRLVGPLDADHCPIDVSVQYEAADEGLGLSGTGAQRGENLVCYKDGAPQSTIDIMIHELCHSAGMAAIDGNAPPPGIPQPKTTAEVDPDNQDAGGSTLGHLYSGHDHSGGHCARGLTDAQKAGDHYGGLPGTCINFGETDFRDPSTHTDRICATCAIILKGRELTSV